MESFISSRRTEMSLYKINTGRYLHVMRAIVRSVSGRARGRCRSHRLAAAPLAQTYRFSPVLLPWSLSYDGETSWRGCSGYGLFHCNIESRLALASFIPSRPIAALNGFFKAPISFKRSFLRLLFTNFLPYCQFRTIFLKGRYVQLLFLSAVHRLL